MIYRYQLKRGTAARGWSKPPDGVGCSRPGPWGNPYIVGQPVPEQGVAFANELLGGVLPVRLDFPTAVRLFELDLLAGWEVGLVTYDVGYAQRMLRDRPLGCWCPQGARCHTEPLARAANDMPPSWRPDFREGPPWPTS